MSKYITITQTTEKDKMTKFRPLLAADAADTEINFPVLASPKLDGIRCIMVEQKAMSRAMKPIPNRYVRSQLEMYGDVLDGVDGELMVGDEFNSTTSGIMSHGGTPKFTYHVFDIYNIKRGFEWRFEKLQQRELPSFCNVVPHVEIRNQDALDEYNSHMLLEGYEGIMLRSMQGLYKNGRSTAKQGILLKLKPFEDSEAVIVGFEELKHNDNEKTTNELGLSKRSSKKEGKRGANTLGKFIVRGLEEDHFRNVEWRIGTGQGLTHELRAEVWANQKNYLGRIIKFKYQKIGSIDKPRLPIFLGFRDRRDM